MINKLENKKNNIFVVIPAFNESERIYEVLQNIKNNLNLKSCNLNLVVVDDGSADNTYAVAKQAGVDTLRHYINRGQGAALVTGTKHALAQGADIIVHFDADGQHDPEDIVKLIEPIVTNKSDIVLGSRFLRSKIKDQRSNTNNLLVTSYQLLATKEVPLFRRLILLASLAVNTFITGVILTDSHNGLRAFSKGAIENMELTQDRMAHATEYITEIKRLNLNYIEVPVTVSYEVNKKSQGFFEGIKILKDLLLGHAAK